MLSNGLQVNGVIVSPLRGPAGNVEFLAHLALGSDRPGAALDEMVEGCLASVCRETK
jgi:hypothetical protein